VALPLSDALQLIVNLAKARELLIIEAESHMPKGAASQRAKMIATLDTLINDALANTRDRLPETPDDGLDHISRKGWVSVAQHQSQAPKSAAETSSAYANLQRVFDQRSNLNQTRELLDWIRSSHTLLGIETSTIDSAAAATAIFMHRCMAQSQIKQWLDEVRANPGALDATQQRNFALMVRLWLESADLDEKLVDSLSRAHAASNRIWEKAKPKSDFSSWLPRFEEVVELACRKGEALGKAFKTSPYQALLESFNPGLRNETVTKVFSDLRTKLPALIKNVMDRQAAEAPPLPLPPVPVGTQRRIAWRVMKKLGLEENHARLDESSHPFSCGQWDDVRITTRYMEDNMMPVLMNIIHETGHALYNRALPREWKDQPIGDPQSIWVHETQSLFWERQVAASMEFMEFLSPIIKEELTKKGINANGPEWSPENLYKLVTRVKPGLIRVEADEVTYPAHVILRHDLEQKLIDGSLAPKDVPEAWATGMRNLLGLEVPDHAHGCMQDVHWPQGAIGYFPAYTFGALGAAQLMARLKQDVPNVGEHIRKGDFAPIREWMTEHVHRHGSLYDGEELMEKATGKPLSVEPWLEHVKQRYLCQEMKM